MRKNAARAASIRMVLAVLVIFATPVGLGSAGCATVVNGTRQRIQFESRPRGAVVEIDGTVQGVTPLGLDLPRKRSYSVTLRREGYRPVRYSLKRKLSGWVFGALIFGGWVAALIDFAVGSCYYLQPGDPTPAEGRLLQHESGDRLYLVALMRRAGPRCPDGRWRTLTSSHSNSRPNSRQRCRPSVRRSGS